MASARTVVRRGPAPSVAFSHDALARSLVLATIILLVVIRFFTEDIAVLPGLAKVVDVPLLLVLVGVAALTPARSAHPSAGPFVVPGLLFLGISAVAVLANLERVEAGPLGLFLYGFLGPIVFYWAAHRLWPPGNARAFSRLLVALGAVQVVVVVWFDLPELSATKNPDVVSGTFGENAYQLVFFLMVVGAVVASVAAFEPGRLAARVALPLISLFLGIVFLAQYRGLLVTTATAIVLVGGLLAAARGRAKARGILMGTALLAALVTTLSFVAIRFPETKFLPYVEELQRDPFVFAELRWNALRGSLDVFDDRPETLLVGTGPGTFSSRAWLTFVNPPSKRAETNAISLAIGEITGGESYSTDVSDQYVRERYFWAKPLLGSKAINSPMSSYTAVAAEVGLVGLAVILWLYLSALARALRMALQRMRHSYPSDALPALCIGAAVAFFVLLQMAFLDNWLEVMRITIPSWILLAVATKEFEAEETTA